MSKFSTAVPKNATAPLNESTGTGASPISGPLSASPGQRFFDEAALKSYQYVKVDTANNYALNAGATGIAATTTVATANGALAYWAGDPANGVVVTYAPYAQNATTPAYNANAVAGVFLGVVTTGNYTLIQTGGDHSALVTTDAANVDQPGTALVSSTATTSNPGVTGVQPGTAPGYRVVGYARAANTSSAVAAFLVLDKDF